MKKLRWFCLGMTAVALQASLAPRTEAGLIKVDFGTTRNLTADGVRREIHTKTASQLAWLVGMQSLRSAWEMIFQRAMTRMILPFNCSQCFRMESQRSP